MKKYKLTDETIQMPWGCLKRIQALVGDNK